MKLIYLFFVLLLLAVAFGGYDTPRRKGGRYEEDYEDDYYGYDDEDYGFGYNKNQKMEFTTKKKIVPLGKKCCKCIKNMGGKCVKVNCCQQFKITYSKYPVPTMAKPDKFN